MLLLIGGYSPVAPSEAKGDEVKSLNPYWIATQLREEGAKYAALSLCGGELHSCEEAKAKLVRLTQQCSNVFLGTIDINEHAGVPLDLFDTKDPELILLGKPKGSKFLTRIDLYGIASPDIIAIVMCSLESRAFGLVLRLLQGIYR